MTLPLRVTAEAEKQILEIDAWWRENRSAASDLFLNELAESFELISSAPHIGRLYRASPVRHVRRLLLRGSRYHIYYGVTGEAVSVLAVWHAQRGVGPPLRMS